LIFVQNFLHILFETNCPGSVTEELASTTNRGKMDAPSCRFRDTSLEAPSVEARSTIGYDDSDGESGFEGLPVISDDRELLERGICLVCLPEELDTERWAEELSQVTPLILGFEGDGEYAFYRNILDEPEFPFDVILGGNNCGEEDLEEPVPGGNDGTAILSEIGSSILNHFPVLPTGAKSLELGAENENDPRKILSKELQLDDAFCVHYNMDQDDTTGAKHVDPSDITVNMCLHKSKDGKGSYVLFHGTKTLENRTSAKLTNNGTDSTENNNGTVVGDDCTTKEKYAAPSPIRTREQTTDDGDEAAAPISVKEDRFLVPQRQGYATIHFGDHPHETTPLRCGSRTNIILTYIYTDPTRSDATTRSCYC